MVYNLYKDTDSYSHSMVDNIDSTVGTSLVAAGWWKSYR